MRNVIYCCPHVLCGRGPPIKVTLTASAYSYINFSMNTASLATYMICLILALANQMNFLFHQLACLTPTVNVCRDGALRWIYNEMKKVSCWHWHIVCSFICCIHELCNGCVFVIIVLRVLSPWSQSLPKFIHCLAFYFEHYVDCAGSDEEEGRWRGQQLKEVFCSVLQFCCYHMVHVRMCSNPI